MDETMNTGVGGGIIVCIRVMIKGPQASDSCTVFLMSSSVLKF